MSARVDGDGSDIMRMTSGKFSGKWSGGIISGGWRIRPSAGVLGGRIRMVIILGDVRAISK